MHLPSSTDVYNIVYIVAAFITAGTTVYFRQRIARRLRVTMQALLQTNTVIRENMDLATVNQDLSARLRFTEASRNDYKQFCSELEQHLNRISEDLDQAKEQLTRFKDVMVTQEQVIEVLAADRDTAISWARSLASQLKQLGAVASQEPVFVSIPKPKQGS